MWQAWACSSIPKPKLLWDRSANHPRIASLHPRVSAGRGINRPTKRWISTVGTSQPLPAPISSRCLRACFVRGGTSKGIFLLREDLPKERAEWDPIILRVMGSPDPVHARQLDGMGGGISSLSKVVVVGTPTEGTAADVEYTFIQVGVRDAVLDYSGNCGNLSSMVGPFALLSGLVRNPAFATRPGPGAHALATVRSLNTNTSKMIDCTFPVGTPAMPWQRSSGDETILKPLLGLPQAEVAGVPGLASSLVLDFVDPGGARTGALLPSGRSSDLIPARDLVTNLATDVHPPDVPVSLVDATNPTVIIAAEALASFIPSDARTGHATDGRPAAIIRAADIDYAAPHTLGVLEAIRRVGAHRMGLDPAAQAQPKVAVVSPGDDGADLSVRALSMGVLHRAVPMTVGLCIGVASHLPGSVAWSALRASRRSRKLDDQSIGIIRLSHPSGSVEVGAEIEHMKQGEPVRVRSAKVVRTGRWLMSGHVYY